MLQLCPAPTGKTVGPVSRLPGRAPRLRWASTNLRTFATDSSVALRGPKPRRAFDLDKPVVQATPVSNPCVGGHPDR